jgi:glucuronate isomerase
MQLHFGAQRDTSTRLRKLAGPAGGYATFGNTCDIPGLCRFLDELEQADALPRTILYPLNPPDYAAIATLTGSFPGKLQFGAAWWYNDHALGMRQQLDTLAHYGLLATFIGMTTDSRALLSMVRHESFRQVLCDWLGAKVEAGELPADLGWLVRAIGYENARQWIFHHEP